MGRGKSLQGTIGVTGHSCSLSFQGNWLGKEEEGQGGGGGRGEKVEARGRGEGRGGGHQGLRAGTFTLGGCSLLLIAAFLRG